MSTGLLRAVRVVAFKDSQPFRRSIFRYLADNRRMVRWVLRVHAALGRSWLSSALIAAYGLRAFVGLSMPRPGPRLLAVAMYRNERRQIDALQGLLGGEDIGRIDVSKGALLRGAGWVALLRGLLRPRLVRFYLREVHRMNRRGDFLVAARVAETLGFYLRVRGLLPGCGARAVLVSSDSNPYAMAVSEAAKGAGLKTLYVSHGHLPDGTPPTAFDLTLLDGPACEDVYRRSHGLQGKVVYRGAEGRTRPMDVSGLSKPRPTVGVFMSLLTDWVAFGAMLARIRATLNPDKILLRMHPNRVIRDPRALHRLGEVEGLEISDGDRILLDDAERCDLVLAGSSSCHLSVLKFGVPSATVRGLDRVPHDLYRFIEDRIVPSFDAPEDLSVEAVAAFFADPGWPARFARYDASYPDRPCDAAVASAVRELLG